MARGGGIPVRNRPFCDNYDLFKYVIAAAYVCSVVLNKAWLRN